MSMFYKCLQGVYTLLPCSRVILNKTLCLLNKRVLVFRNNLVICCIVLKHVALYVRIFTNKKIFGMESLFSEMSTHKKIRRQLKSRNIPVPDQGLLFKTNDVVTQ